MISRGPLRLAPEPQTARLPTGAVSLRNTIKYPLGKVKLLLGGNQASYSSCRCDGVILTEMQRQLAWFKICNRFIMNQEKLPMTEHSKQAAALGLAMQQANRVTVFTGAGISTESGIPDFRGPQGIWKTQTPIDFSDFVSSLEWRKESWRRRFSGEDRLNQAEPNAGHDAIAHWVATGKVATIITQNVDGLHQKSGVPEANIIELHGNAQYAKCLSCDARVELSTVRDQFLPNETVPDCAVCGGIIKTATISFGQAMPEQEMHAAHTAATDCDLFLAIGSSLTVYPAAGFPALAKQNGAKLIIINHQPTDLDPIADLTIAESIGAVLSEAVTLAP